MNLHRRFTLALVFPAQRRRAHKDRAAGHCARTVNQVSWTNLYIPMKKCGMPVSSSGQKHAIRYLPLGKL